MKAASLIRLAGACALVGAAGVCLVGQRQPGDQVPAFGAGDAIFFE